MTKRQRLFDNPHFISYGKLLPQLQQLLDVGAYETPHGALLREQMDEHSRHLDAIEWACLSHISGVYAEYGK